MITIKVTDELYNYCLYQVNTYNFGKRYTANGNKEQQLTGVIGQSIVMQQFGFNIVQGEKGFDGGTDIEYEGKKIDVKTMGRTTDVKISFTNNFLKLQDYFQTDIYIFCSYHKLKKEITICGWIDKKAFRSKRRLYEKGNIRTRADGTTFTTFADLYEIDMCDLYPIKSIEMLKQNLKNFHP